MTRATRSAHRESDSPALSTLQPVTIPPSSSSTAAPTGKPEKGVTALSDADMAAFTSSRSFFFPMGTPPSFIVKPLRDLASRCREKAKVDGDLQTYSKAQEYLKLLGICRLFLDNIPHIEASILVMGRGIGTIALHSGADDISSVVIEENVLQSYGLDTEVKAREFIRESGFTPAKRDLLYNRIDER